MEVLIGATEKTPPSGPNLQELLPAAKIWCCEYFVAL